ncbi:ABC transporter permease [Alteromonadaceae bacterium BrNp21-10]|nr:ABC transporter permease [Alteromonadaceae bacterium BrNp21-10]
MTLLSLATKSLLNRRYTLGLSLLAVAMSVMMLLGVERLQQQIKSGFAQTISATDLIVGPRSSPLTLLLSTVFDLAEQNHGMSWQSYQQIKNMPDVQWVVPLSFGDSHEGYRVVGTLPSYFIYRQFANKTSLSFQQGRAFTDDEGVVLGAMVAQKLGYQLGDQVVLSHGLAARSFSQHRQHPLKVVGILAMTGTPVDKRLFVDLQAIEEMHATAEHHDAHQQPDKISGLLMGATSKFSLLNLLRDLNEFTPEPLTAILPQVALQQLWNLMSVVEKGLMVLSVLVVVTGLIGLLTNILTNLHQRHRELAILRALGAAPRHIFTLLMGEMLLLGCLGCALGVGLFYAAQVVAAPLVQQSLGMPLMISMLSLAEWQLLGLLLVAIIVVGFVPAIRAYRMTLHDGMQIRS